MRFTDVNTSNRMFHLDFFLMRTQSGSIIRKIWHHELRPFKRKRFKLVLLQTQFTLLPMSGTLLNPHLTIMIQAMGSFVV